MGLNIEGASIAAGNPTEISEAMVADLVAVAVAVTDEVVDEVAVEVAAVAEAIVATEIAQDLVRDLLAKRSDWHAWPSSSPSFTIRTTIML